MNKRDTLIINEVCENEKKIIYWERLHTIVLIILTIVEVVSLFTKLK